jgi:hypothetical protein
VTTDIGRCASRRSAALRAEPTALSQAKPAAAIARLRYEFFTPYHQGFDLVWDFLCDQNKATFSDGILTISGSYGYERARDLKLSARGVQIGSGTELWERFAALEPVFHSFWSVLETAAADWQKRKRQAEDAHHAEAKRRDDELCNKILALAAGSRRAKMPQAVECEASQSSPKGNAQKEAP